MPCASYSPTVGLPHIDRIISPHHRAAAVDGGATLLPPAILPKGYDISLYLYYILLFSDLLIDCSLLSCHRKEIVPP